MMMHTIILELGRLGQRTGICCEFRVTDTHSYLVYTGNNKKKSQGWETAQGKVLAIQGCGDPSGSQDQCM